MAELRGRDQSIPRMASSIEALSPKMVSADFMRQLEHFEPKGGITRVYVSTSALDYFLS